ncbi:MAG TPA: T9SS type A sorting domain-containing protein [Saprospiraceae bacterium]|nr:T9SS type A sorting domain-containing protein [Saprospiraceae bacterium]
MKRFFTVFSILFITTQVFSQALTRGVCGNMPSEAAEKKLLASKALFEKLDIIQIEDLKYVPIKFHLIAKTDGTGRVKEYDILRQLCVLNEDYSDTEFRFYIKDADFSYYDSDYIYDSPRTSQLATNQMQALKNANNNAVNVFVVNNIGGGAGGLGTVLGYYSGAKDWIVMIKKEPQAGSNTLSHEMGHFFSLLHTFNGWEGAPFQSSSAGWPKAPFNSPGGPQTENQDGSNCSVAGDKLCDTPPDYNFGIIWNNCNYTGGAQDYKGDLVDPMENNQMCYFSGCYPYVFTSDQINMMYGDYAKTSRNYIKSSYVPNNTQVTTHANLVSPTNGANTGGNIGVVLDWEDIPDADHYLLEVSRYPNFSKLNQNYIVSESQKELPELTPNVNYFWRVTPFNDGASCVAGLTSSKWKFATKPLAISNIEEINAWDVVPNPTTLSQVRFAIEIAKPLDITAQVVNVNGQILQSKELTVHAGNQVVQLPEISLPNGTYYLRLISDKGMETRRVVIQK